MAPRYIFIEPTNTCNITCVMCPVPDNSMMTRKRKMLTLDRLATILDANPKLKVVYLTNWGEPLLHKQIVEIIRVCASRGLMVVMTSNATLMTPAMAKQILEAGLGVVRFSLDGVDEYFEKIRSVKYNTVAKNIEGFLEERNRGGYKTRVELNVTYMPENLPGVEAVHGRWADKVDFINYQGVISIPTIKISNRKDHADRHPGCRQIYRSAFFLTNGTVAPCCADFNGELVLGDVDTSQNVSPS